MEIASQLVICRGMQRGLEGEEGGIWRWAKWRVPVPVQGAGAEVGRAQMTCPLAAAPVVEEEKEAEGMQREIVYRTHLPAFYPNGRKVRWLLINSGKTTKPP